LKIILIIILSFISLFLTYLIWKVAVKLRLYNYPNERSSHEIPTPRIGGIAIILTWYPGVILFFNLGLIEKNLFYALLCGLIIALVSLIDDLKGVSAILRLLVHISVSVLAFYFLGGLRHFFLQSININYLFYVYPIVILGMVWFINLFNFMDGIDGFAANEAITIAVILFIFSGNYINLLLAGCIMGFLYWNWPRAKIFMGDVGSTQLGFILIVLGIYFHNTLHFSILNWVMLAAPFWFDASYTLFLRWRNNEKLSQAHRKHAYQRFVQAGFSHKQVNKYLMIINFIILLFIMAYRSVNLLKLPLTFLTIFMMWLIYKKVGKKVPF